MSNVSGAGDPVSLGDLNFVIRPLTDRDHGELTGYLRSQVIKVSNEAARDLPDDEAAAVREAAASVACTISWTSPAGAKQMRSPDGLARILWQSSRVTNPNLTHEQIRKAIMNNLKDVPAALDTFLLINNFKVDELKSEQEALT